MVTVPITQEYPMILSCSAIVLLAVITFLFCRKDGLKASHCIVCVLLGFYLAGTPTMAGPIRASSASLASLLGGIRF